MSSKKASDITIADLDVLTLDQAMAYTHRLSEKSFKEEIEPHVYVRMAAGKLVYVKSELLRAMMREEFIVRKPIRTHS